MNYYYVGIVWKYPAKDGHYMSGHVVLANNEGSVSNIANDIALEKESEIHSMKIKELNQNNIIDKRLIERRRNNIGGRIWEKST